MVELSSPHRYRCKAQPRYTIVNILDIRAIEDEYSKAQLGNIKLNIWISELSDPYRDNGEVQQGDTIVNFWVM